MENDNNSEEHSLGKEAGRTFLLNLAASAGMMVGMFGGLLAIGYAAKKMQSHPVTPPIISE